MPRKPHEPDLLAKLTKAHTEGERAKGISLYKRWLDLVLKPNGEESIGILMSAAFRREYPAEAGAYFGDEPTPGPRQTPPPERTNSPEDLGMHSRVAPASGPLFDESEVKNPVLRELANRAAQAQRDRK